MSTSDYLPVMLSVDHPHPELEAWVADRFAVLNKRDVFVIRRENLHPDALQGHPAYAKAWLWDAVPEDTQRVLFFDFDVIPLRPLPELPEAPFAAVPDAGWYVDRMRGMYPSFARTRYVFNSGFFVAHRSTRSCFDQLKSFAVTLGYENPYGNTYEQTPLNHLIQSTVEVSWLPRTFHCLAHTDYHDVPNAYMLHLSGVPGNARWVMMAAMRDALKLNLLAESTCQ